MESNIQVVLRFRPLLSFEQEECWLINEKSGTIASMVSQRLASKVETKLKKKVGEQNLNQISYQFQNIMGAKTKTQEIYNRFCFNIINECMGGVNGTIFAYGQTCSGKTYSINKTEDETGILPHALRHILLQSSKSQLDYQISASYIEIYNEVITDLLQPSLTNLKIQDDPKWGIQVKATKAPIKTLNQALEILEKGESNRSYRKKLNHEHSSRSHVIFRIYIESNNDTLIKSKSVHKYSVLNIVDLAGSERCSKNQSFNPETGSINKSLFMLSNVITKLVEKQSQKTVYIPYRDSKLTRLLQNSLGGNSSTLVLCCLSPSLSSFQQTTSTLRFADIVKKVKNVKKENKELGENEELRGEIKLLKQEVRQLKAKYLSLCDDHQELKVKYNNALAKEKQIGLSIKEVVREKVVRQVTLIVDEFSVDAVWHNFSSEKSHKDELRIQKVMEQFKRRKIELIGDMIREFVGKENAQRIREININSLRQGINSEKEYRNLQKAMIQGKMREIQCNKDLDRDEINRLIEYYSDILSSVMDSFSNEQPIHHECYLWGSNKDYRIANPKQTIATLNKISDKVQDLALGTHHTLFVQDSEVYGCGKNNYCQIVDDSDLENENNCVQIPRKVSNLIGIVSVAAGWGHSLALDSNGMVFSWGYGQQGQLGHGTLQNIKAPKIIDTLHKAVSIYAGHSHSGYIDQRRDFYTFGCNVDYRLMQEGEGIHPTLAHRKVRSAAFGVNHTCIITQSDELYGGGDASYGQLGILNEEMTKYYPKSKMFEDEKSTSCCPITQIYLPQQVKPCKVSCGQHFTIILCNDRRVYGIGKGSHYRLGNGMLTNEYSPTKIQGLVGIIDVETGCRHALALSEEGGIYGWGFNMHNQITLSSAVEYKTPILLADCADTHPKKIKAGGFHSGFLS